MTLSLPLRRRSQAAGVLESLIRVVGGEGLPGDLLALAGGPLSLLASAATRVRPPAAVIGVLPVQLGDGVAEIVARALAHRAVAEAELVELSAPGPCPVGALDIAGEVVRRLLTALPGATARIDQVSLQALAEGAQLDVAGAAARLRAAGVGSVLGELGSPLCLGPLPVMARTPVPPAIDAAFVAALVEGPPRALSIAPASGTTGITVLRAVALARLAGHGPIAVRALDELKGPDAALAFGADAVEAELDPPGTLGARTRSYGEAAVRGAQRELKAPLRRAPEGKRVPRILDEHVPAGLDGAVSLHVVPAPEIRP